jgi:hypothetical protein
MNVSLCFRFVLFSVQVVADGAPALELTTVDSTSVDVQMGTGKQ